MHNLSIMIVRVLLFIIIFSFLKIISAYSEVKFFDLEEIRDWQLVAEINNNKKTCHAIIRPYKNKLILGEIVDPKFIISYKGYLSYSISFSCSTALALSNSILLFINDSRYMLKTTKYKENAITYSAEQDIDIINNMITGSFSFKIRSQGEKGELNLIYFSSLGFNEVINYMENNCRNLGDVK